jgi:hypothetical protein
VNTCYTKKFERFDAEAVVVVAAVVVAAAAAVVVVVAAAAAVVTILLLSSPLSPLCRVFIHIFLRQQCP